MRRGPGRLLRRRNKARTPAILQYLKGNQHVPVTSLHTSKRSVLPASTARGQTFLGPIGNITVFSPSLWFGRQVPTSLPTTHCTETGSGGGGDRQSNVRTKKRKYI